MVLPEWDAMVGVKQNTIHHKYDVAEHTLHTLKHVKRDKYLRLTMLFHDMGKPAMKTTDEKGNDHFKGHALESEKIARTVLKRLKFDNETIRIVTKLVCYHDYRMEATPANVRRAMNRIGVELFPYYLAVRLADAKSQSTYMRREKIENIVEIRNLYKQILMENQCVTLRQLAVSGRELMELGMKPGRELGAMLSELLEYVLDDPERNTKENLCKYVKEKMEKEIIAANGKGIQVRLHAIGDGAVRLALDLYEKSEQVNGKKEFCNTIEHIENIAESDIDRFRGHNIIASMQPYHLTLTNNKKINQIGAKRCELEWPVGTLLKHGAKLALSTDYPVVDLNPFVTLYAAVTRRDDAGRPTGHNPWEKISMEDALKAYTAGSAKVYQMEKQMGTIEEGKFANIIVLSHNLFAIDPEEIRDTRVIANFFEGKKIIG